MWNSKALYLSEALRTTERFQERDVSRSKDVCEIKSLEIKIHLMKQQIKEIQRKSADDPHNCNWIVAYAGIRGITAMHLCIDLCGKSAGVVQCSKRGTNTTTHSDLNPFPSPGFLQLQVKSQGATCLRAWGWQTASHSGVPAFIQQPLNQPLLTGGPSRHGEGGVLPLQWVSQKNKGGGVYQPRL